jgi:signal peptide peptidase SppA
MHGMELQTHSPAAGGLDLGFRLASVINAQPMAMREAELDQLVNMLAANRFSLPRNRKLASRITEKGTAILEVHGILVDRFPMLGSFWGINSYEGLAEQFRRHATDPNVKRIVIDLDSPGGMVRGLGACADELQKLAEVKPVYAIAHNMACSAGYWLAASAQELSVTPDGCVGSIGVRASHISYAEALDRDGVAVTTFKAGATKADLAAFAPLDHGAAAEVQFGIDRAYDRFCEHIAAHRPLTVDQARATDARTFEGEKAIEAKLADRVETLEELIERVEKSAATVKPKRKPAIEPGSKAGLAPASRNPVPPAPDDEAPAAGKSHGANTMTKPNAAELAAAITVALENSGLRAEGDQPAAAAPAPAAAPAATVDREAIVTAERERIFGILEAAEADGKGKLAIELAKSGITVDAAKSALAAAPSPAPAAAADEKAARDSSFDKAMQDAKNSGGVKPEASKDSKRQSFVEFAAATAGKA